MSIPELTEAQEGQLVHALHHFALGHGLDIYPVGFSEHAPVATPTTLYPTPFPAKAFERAETVQPLFNELYAKVSSDVEYLSGILDEFAKYDAGFTGKLWESYKKAKKEGIKQPITLGVFRSDYMLDNDEIKQVEFNTVSVSFGGLSTKVGELHKYLNNAGYYTGGAAQYYDNAKIPVSESLDKLAAGLADGVLYYNKTTGSKNTIVLEITQEGERNVFDQRHLEYSLIANFGIKTRRITLQDIPDKTYKDDKGKLFLKETKEEVSLVYYRSGYAPSDFKTEEDWQNRVTLETSLAIKAPSLLTQLSGAKKIQQLLTESRVLSKFVTDETHKKQLESTFVKIWPLDKSDEGLIARKLANEEPERFVLKPQREGGGNNVYKKDIPGFLAKLPEEEWNAYILMELIHPPLHKNKVVREGKVYTDEIVSELGRFGTILFNQETTEVLENKDAGWLLRSKFSTSDEGGVAAGFGCVDGVALE
ncbi:Glutathione synthetase [Cyberlindnera fabianii]|uniref:Glutathione synthetase n=1 Tax=Cyberlindnera fabianii TaxID=36022 RepID=A0A1V2L747_CYBFA|nr:Glutathione synthetase [Cyberlindnera fabianii]